nr:hypothetical protein [Dyella sp. A6]
MHIFTQLIAMNRARQLQRQLHGIERQIRALPARSRIRLSMLTLREIGHASQCDFPHLYATPPEQRYTPWGQGTAIGFARAQSDNSEVALRGIALWLAVAYHESKNAQYACLQAPHRQVLRVLRELKEQRGDAREVAAQWMNSSAAA